MPDSQNPGSSPSLQELFLAESPWLLHLAARLAGGSTAAAQDLVQDAFLRLHAHWGAVENPRAWLFATVRNLAKNRIRKNARQSSLDAPGAPDTARMADESAPAPPASLERAEAVVLIHLCLDALPPLDRLLVKLKFEDNLSYAEIARAAGLSVSNVGFRLHHIVKRLTAAYHKAENGGKIQ